MLRLWLQSLVLEVVVVCVSGGLSSSTTPLPSSPPAAAHAPPPSSSLHPPACSAFDPTGTWSLYIPLIPAAANNQPSVIYWRSSSGPLSPSPGVGARNVRGAKEKNKAALRDELSASGTLTLWIEPIEKIIPVSFCNLYPEIRHPPPLHTRVAQYLRGRSFSVS